MKKHNQDVSTTPSWIVRLDDDEDEEDPEFYGAPAFESRLVPEGYKETTRHNHIIQEQYIPTSLKRKLTEIVTENLALAFVAAVSEIQSAFPKFIVSAATERGKQDKKVFGSHGMHLINGMKSLGQIYVNI
ncbi:hypothetical protein SO802_022355 [Lithocarpus litseifolius]|uniref:Uncharacterized protein n=1 Tax=Lithocarpus litseifolius TaxID=425828 RepID=A0AAW2CLT2_9ROSI